MVTQCCLCYRVQSGEGEETSWKKVKDAPQVSRTAQHTFCEDCEQKFRERFDLLVQPVRKAG